MLLVNYSMQFMTTTAVEGFTCFLVIYLTFCWYTICENQVYVYTHTWYVISLHNHPTLPLYTMHNLQVSWGLPLSHFYSGCGIALNRMLYTCVEAKVIIPHRVKGMVETAVMLSATLYTQDISIWQHEDNLKAANDSIVSYLITSQWGRYEGK